jgi:hypothetical protein
MMHAWSTGQFEESVEAHRSFIETLLQGERKLRSGVESLKLACAHRCGGGVGDPHRRI